MDIRRSRYIGLISSKFFLQQWPNCIYVTADMMFVTNVFANCVAFVLTDIHQYILPYRKPHYHYFDNLFIQNEYSFVKNQQELKRYFRKFCDINPEFQQFLATLWILIKLLNSPLKTSRREKIKTQTCSGWQSCSWIVWTKRELVDFPKISLETIFVSRKRTVSTKNDSRFHPKTNSWKWNGFKILDRSEKWSYCQLEVGRESASGCGRAQSEPRSAQKIAGCAQKHKTDRWDL